MVGEQRIGRIFKGEMIPGYITGDIYRTSVSRDVIRAISYEQGAISWGHGKGAGPIHYFAMFDPLRSVFAYTTGGATWSQTAAEYTERPPMKNIPKADLSSFQSHEGLHLGSNLAEVSKVFGQPALILLPDGCSLAFYERSTRLKPGLDATRYHTSFVLCHGKVVGMSYAFGG